ncbi:MAG: sugar phosphate isomerase/epimerase [Limnochordaceae bacterium]|nr:sugar phosphate isomerase/epimerase [Limnochordaceae bacterium]
MRLGLITDEVGQDLEEAIALAQEFGIRDLELRTVWGRNVVDLTLAQVDQVRRRLEQVGMRVASVAGPVLKCPWPSPHPRGAQTGEGENTGGGTAVPVDLHGGPAEASVEEHTGRLFQRELELAQAWDAPFIRIFSFWRQVGPTVLTDDEELDEIARWVAPLLPAAAAAGRQVLLENEYACSIGSGQDSRRLLERPELTGLGLIWDPGNAFWVGERPYPDGYEQVRRVDEGRRVRHVHVKDARRTDRPEQPYEWVAVGEGEIDYPGQFAALARDGFDGVLSLETHWDEPRLSGVERSRRCLQGMEQALRQAGLRRDGDGEWSW